jgi:predicted extracellular nuclease
LLPGSTTTVPNDTNWRAHSYDFSAVSSLNNNANARFRIYGYAAGGTTGAWRIDDVTFGDNSIAITPIGLVQGSVADSVADPFTFATSYVGQQVTLSGIVTDRMITRSSGGAIYYNFYLQERPADSDGNPLSSDGIHVYIGTSPSFNGYTPVIGDQIVVRGTVSEYFNDTELTGPALIANNGNVGNIDTAVPAMPISPTATITGTGIMYERIEGMRAFVAAGAPVVAPTHLYRSTDDTEMYVIRPDHPVAQRANAYERRVFRDGTR